MTTEKCHSVCLLVYDIMFFSPKNRPWLLNTNFCLFTKFFQDRIFISSWRSSGDVIRGWSRVCHVSWDTSNIIQCCTTWQPGGQLWWDWQGASQVIKNWFLLTLTPYLYFYQVVRHYQAKSIKFDQYSSEQH